jgi:hypothetical protein
MGMSEADELSGCGLAIMEGSVIGGSDRCGWDVKHDELR